MEVQTLDGVKYKWSFSSIQQDNKSEPHIQVRHLLKKLCPTSLIVEEVQIQVKRNRYLYLDFYIPLYKIAVEIDGRQHREFNPFFHGTEANFMKQKINDKNKEEWCKLNDIMLIRLNDDESNDQWESKFCF